MCSIRSSLALILLLGVQTARAQAQAPADPTPVQEPTRADTARTLFEQGRDKHHLGQYAEAIELFRRSYELVPAPLLLFNLAQSYRLAGDCINAVSYYQQFTRLAGDSPTRIEAERWLKEISPCAALSPAMVAPPSKPAIPAIAPPPPSTPPPGAVTATTPSEIPRAPRPSRLRPRIGMALIAAGLVAGALGTYFAIDASQAADRTTNLAAAGGTWDANARSNESSGLRSQLISRIGFILTVPLLGSGSWVWLATP